MMRVNPLIASLLVLASSASMGVLAAEGPVRKGMSAKGPPGELALMAYTYRKFSLFEAVDHAKALGLKYLETYEWLPISPELKDVQFNADAPMSALARVKNKLDDAGVELSGLYARELGKSEDATRKVFDFAKLMDIPTIIAEPPAEPQAYEMVDRLAQEYRIRVAVHNHPAPSTYADPETALKLIKDRSQWIGVCADTGHWVRSGLKPAECLKMYAGRIIQLHLKDVPEPKKQAHDVPWGTGVGDVKAQLGR